MMKGLNQIEVLFGDWKCLLQIDYYPNDRIRIDLLDAYDKSPVAIATVNIPNVPLKPNEVIIKDYNENEGMLVTLMNAGVISAPLRYVRTGWIDCPVCRLLIRIEVFDVGCN